MAQITSYNFGEADADCEVLEDGWDYGAAEDERGWWAWGVEQNPYAAFMAPRAGLLVPPTPELTLEPEPGPEDGAVVAVTVTA
eukprot:SAG11_NODE_4731_length_1788_cov_1.167555_1_plen_82_part_10